MATLNERVAALEKTNVGYELLLAALQKQDSDTAHALEALEGVINDPKIGLIVTIDRFQESAKADRKAQLAFFAGLVVVVNVLAPFIPFLLHALFPQVFP